MAEVKIDHLVKIYNNEVTAVDDLVLDVADGEFLVLLGPSGCGKTTTLRCVAGLERQSYGNIWIGNRIVNYLSPGERDIAFVFQFYALYPHLNAYDNIAFPLRAAGLTSDEVDRRVRGVADVLRLHGALRKRPKNLSSGEQQRVALGRAIIRRPQVFLMDEPLTNLDAALRADMRVEIKHLQRELATTMLYVTHDQTEAMSMGHRIAVMHKGVLQQVDTPTEVYRNPATLFVASFIGDPPMNLIPVKLDGDVLRGTDSRLRVRLDQEVANQIRQKQTGPDLVLGVRAEDIHITDAGANGAGDLAVNIATREPLGDETIYSVVLDEGRVLLITTEATVYFDPETPVELTFDRSRLHVYDAVTEQALL